MLRIFQDPSSWALVDIAQGNVFYTSPRRCNFVSREYFYVIEIAPSHQARMANRELALQLGRVASLYVNDPFRRRAYLRAADVIAKHPTPISSGWEAKQLRGIGTSIAAKIDEYLTQGYISLLGPPVEVDPQAPSIPSVHIQTPQVVSRDIPRVDLSLIQVQPRAVVPRLPGVPQPYLPPEVIPEEQRKVMNLFKGIHGVGEVTAKKWYQQGFRTIESLQVLVPGMNRAQRLGYKYYSDFKPRIDRCEMEIIDGLLTKVIPWKHSLAGSYRRGLDTSGDIDLLIETVDGRPSMQEVLQPLRDSGLLVVELTPNAKVKFMGAIRIPTPFGEMYPARRLDIRLIDAKSWPFALLYFTGSKEFNVRLRNRALELGYSLSEYNITREAPHLHPSQSTPANEEFKSEEDIFKYLNVRYISPEQRTDEVKLDPLQVSKMDGLLFYHPPGMKISKYIAGFDLDGTLIRSKSGRPIAIQPDDIELIPEMMGKLEEYAKLGYTPVIFTNQKMSEMVVVPKLNLVLSKIKTPVVLLAALKDDMYRKPRTGMWEYLRKVVNVDLEKSFYIGDAAGRPGDHSDSDLQFARNIGIKFYVP